MRSSTIILLLIAGVLILSAVALQYVRKSYDVSTYVCLHCSLRKTESTHAIGGWIYRSKRTFESTGLMAILGGTNCSHQWLLFSFGRGAGGMLRGWQVQADGGSPGRGMMAWLSHDPRFANELGSMPQPRAAWSNLVVALDTHPPLSDVLFEWWWGGEGGGSFSNWWDQVGREVSRNGPDASVPGPSRARGSFDPSALTPGSPGDGSP